MLGAQQKSGLKAGIRRSRSEAAPAAASTKQKKEAENSQPRHFKTLLEKWRVKRTEDKGPSRELTVACRSIEKTPRETLTKTLHFWGKYIYTHTHTRTSHAS